MLSRDCPAGIEQKRLVSIKALGIGADTGQRLKPVQYKQKARAAGNAQENLRPHAIHSLSI